MEVLGSRLVSVLGNVEATRGALQQGDTTFEEVIDECVGQSMGNKGGGGLLQGDTTFEEVIDVIIMIEWKTFFLLSYSILSSIPLSLSNNVYLYLPQF